MNIFPCNCAELYNCPGYWRASGVSREIDLLTWKMKMRGPTVSYKDDPLKKQMFPQDDQPVSALKKQKLSILSYILKNAKECLKYLTFRHVMFTYMFVYQYF